MILMHNINNNIITQPNRFIYSSLIRYIRTYGFNNYLHTSTLDPLMISQCPQYNFKL